MSRFLTVGARGEQSSPDRKARSGRVDGSVQPRLEYRTHPAAGWVIVSAALFATLALAVRKSTRELHPFEVVFLRNLFGLAMLLPWAMWSGLIRSGTKKYGAYTLRAVFELLTMLLWFTGLSALPLAEAVALSFTSPLFATIGAAAFLREEVTPVRWLAIGGGLAGTLLMLRPGPQAVSSYAILVLLASACGSAGTLIAKHLTMAVTPASIVFYMTLLLTPLSLVPAVFVWRAPSWPALAWTAVAAVVATLAHLAMVRSLSLADASTVMPWKYIQLPFTAALAYLVLGEVPDAWASAGAALIAICAIVVTVWGGHRTLPNPEQR